MYRINKIYNLNKNKLPSKIKLHKSTIEILNTKYKNYIIKIYIIGEGCYGLKYGFCIEKLININDIIIQKKNTLFSINNLSYIYIIGSKIKYNKNINNSKFIIKNPKIKKNCNCGNSFNLK